MKRLSDEQILDELEIEFELNSTKVLTPLEERLISGFEEINIFYETHQRVPSLDDAGIFEKICASRLEKIKQNSVMSSIVVHLDKF
ncbi:hypothetical protein J0A78_01285 [Providencia rettgeri]|uniref:hypothetical protein n=1 Tax=Morganellaceae TaxID=1903414 RepID=UPI0005B31F8E|nr:MULTISPECIES: hypothetical protein [Morganellaceae]ELR5188791.1 hypothetical protein [Providencia rettgeri]MBG5985005.1 hypothetical protein [Proteus vulgaris]MBJ9973427.1 hypothetical protein [Providencia rettgeri]MBN7840480.1 hypothetical protein [Providencia rettgeri]MBN7852208.1 hypothetical protein [Providencia rettgeri]